MNENFFLMNKIENINFILKKFKLIFFQNLLLAFQRKISFCNFNSTNTQLFSICPQKKIIFAESLLLCFFIIFFPGCYSYEIMLHSKYDTIKMRRVTIPPRIWASFDTTGEEDLRNYCGNRPLLLVKFRNNTPIEVWCRED